MMLGEKETHGIFIRYELDSVLKFGFTGDEQR
jgi:hypothetical protein